MNVFRSCLSCRVSKAKVSHLIHKSNRLHLFMPTVVCSVIVFVPFAAAASNES